MMNQNTWTEASGDELENIQRKRKKDISPYRQDLWPDAIINGRRGFPRPLVVYIVMQHAVFNIYTGASFRHLGDLARIRN